MKPNSFVAALALMLAAAPAWDAAADSGVPGASRTKPSAMTPPPRPGALDKLIVCTQPPPEPDRPRKQPGPNVADDLAAPEHANGSTCYPAAGPACVDSLIAACDRRRGGMSTNPDGSVTCTVY